MRRKREKYTPDRGHAVWLTFNPQAGQEQAGRRPAIILSPAIYNSKTGLAILCPVTSQAKGYPFEVEIPRGLPLSGSILADQVRNLDWQARRAAHICDLPQETTDEVLAKLEALLRR